MRLNSKGQVTIPAPLRERHGLHEGDEVDVIEDGENVRSSTPRPAAPAGRGLCTGCAAGRPPRWARTSCWTCYVANEPRFRSVAASRPPVTFVDSSVMLDILTQDAAWAQWSGDALARPGQRHAGYQPDHLRRSLGRIHRIEDLDDAVPAADLGREPLPYQAGSSRERHSSATAGKAASDDLRCRYSSAPRRGPPIPAPDPRCRALPHLLSHRWTDLPLSTVRRWLRHPGRVGNCAPGGLEAFEHKPHRHRAFPDGGRGPLDGPAADIADGEDSRAGWFPGTAASGRRHRAGLGGMLLPVSRKPRASSASWPASHPVAGCAPMKTNRPRTASADVCCLLVSRSSTPSSCSFPSSAVTCVRGVTVMRGFRSIWSIR